MNGPCLDCPYRRVGCHSYCRNYKEYKDKLNTLKKKDEYESYLMETGGGYYRMRTRKGVMRI